MRRLILVLVAALVTALVGASHSLATPTSTSCGMLLQSECGVHSHPATQTFRGLIGIADSPGFATSEATLGTQPGCGDCVWTVLLACPGNTPTNGPNQASCNGATEAPGCRHGVEERIYLSDAEVADAYEGEFCLHGRDPIVPIGQIAAGDVGRYLHDVTPPDQTVTTRPKVATLAGLRTYFLAHPPGSLRPSGFGGGPVTETITLAPQRADWTWGDGTDSGWIEATSTTTHAYVHGGVDHGTLRTRWGATYTIGYGGATFGPYPATGTLVTVQQFTERVHTSSPVITS